MHGLYYRFNSLRFRQSQHVKDCSAAHAVSSFHELRGREKSAEQVHHARIRCRRSLRVCSEFGALACAACTLFTCTSLSLSMHVYIIVIGCQRLEMLSMHCVCSFSIRCQRFETMPCEHFVAAICPVNGHLFACTSAAALRKTHHFGL